MRGTLTGQRYDDDILRPHVRRFLKGLSGVIFQQDNARPHTARVAQDFLRHFQTLRYVARSPDLSPVEHVWLRCYKLRGEVGYAWMTWNHIRTPDHAREMPSSCGKDIEKPEKPNADYFSSSCNSCTSGYGGQTSW
ncbi:transposable element Tcb2 transposase [Trichonephila clavipes]|nr:transposable element Tcb2 transposase [Trichonephila clavipes]